MEHPAAMIGKTTSHYKILDIWKDADDDLLEKKDAQKRLAKLLNEG